MTPDISIEIEGKNAFWLTLLLLHYQWGHGNYRAYIRNLNAMIDGVDGYRGKR